MHESFLSSSKSEAASSAFSSPIVTKHHKNVNIQKRDNFNSSSSGGGGVDLNEIYKNNRRCGEIDGKMREGHWRMASFRFTVQIAEIIFDKWEHNDRIAGEGRDLRSRRQQFSNYVVGFVMRVGPCCVTLLHALQYILKLRSIYPRARGEQGCAHRLFAVALLVATRYLNDRQVLVKPTHTSWSMLSGVFSGPELSRMEGEFVTFLRGSLFVGLTEIERSVEDLLGRGEENDLGAVVPGSVDWLELISVKIKAKCVDDEDSTVPYR